MLDEDDLPVALLLFFEVQPGISATWGFYAAPRPDSAADSLSAWITVEVAAIAGMGFGLRALARYLLRSMPGIGATPTCTKRSPTGPPSSPA